MERWQLGVMWLFTMAIAIVPAWLIFRKIEKVKPQIKNVQPRVESYKKEKGSIKKITA